MNSKQLIGFVALTLGVILIIFATHGMGYIPEKSPKPQVLTNSPISPTERLPENAPIGQSKGYCMRLWMSLGIVLVLAGGVAVIRFNKYGA